MRHSGQTQARCHFAVPACRAASATNVHSQPVLFPPVDCSRECVHLPQVHAEIAALDGNQIPRCPGLCPKRRSATGNIVHLELNMVIAIWNNSAAVGQQSCLKVQIRRGRTLHFPWINNPQRKSKKDARHRNEYGFSNLLF